MYPLDAKEKNWQEPVEWDDGRWLYVPSLDESKILNAMAYLFDSGNTHVFEDCNQPQLALPAFEIRNDISSEEVQNINSRIKLNLLNALFLLKSVYGNTNEVELLDKLKERAKEVLKDNGWHKD